ncbi:MAG: chromosome segregation protein SMC [Firmicutes bacterium]|nr:chromosome segregation protein SMC [Bacillota bacterium]
MFLKRLEIHGFKSFGEKTKLEFGRGITAIVGPNGSGKSNIADGVRWVLGEQSARTLRGDTMQDVIFAGSDGKGPLGMAEVSLTLGDCRGKFGLDFDEITVARRVYRSGESQYLINKSPCRLRDIHDLFRDTGLGREGYSLIGQGQIDAILQARPWERRLIIEEAAGIGKYRTRKAEATKKLADTEGKLLRLDDIMGELERQLEPLARSAAKAKTYLTLSAEYQEKGRTLCAYEWSRLQADDRLLLAKQSKIAANLAEVHDAQQLDDAMAASLRQEIVELESHIEGLRKARDEKIEERTRVQRRQDRAKDRLQYVLAEINRLDKEGEEARLRRKSIRQDLAQCLWQGRSLKRVWQKELQEVARLEEAQTKGYEARQRLLDELQAIGLAKEEIRQKIAVSQANLQSNQSRGALWQEQLLVLTRRQEEVSRQLDALEVSVEEREATCKLSRQELVATQASLESLETTAQAVKARWSKQLEVVRQAEEKLQVESSRLEALTAMEKGYVGYHNGVRAVLQRRHLFPGICGVVAELIEVPKELGVAIEIALGGALQNIVTDDDIGPRQAVSYLKKYQAGRATFLPLDGLRITPFPKGLLPLLERENVIGLASNLVGYESRYQRLVDYLLGRVIVTRDLDTAVALSKDLRGSYRIVTLDGDTVSAGGAITGGSLPRGEKSGLLQRRQEIGRLAKARQELQRAVAIEKQRVEAFEVELKEKNLAIGGLQDDLRQHELQIRDEQQAIKLARGEIARWEREREHIEQEIRDLQVKIASGTKAQSTDMLNIDSLTAKEAIWQAKALVIEERLERLAGFEAQHQERFTNYKVGVATRESQIQALGQEIARHRKALREIAGLLDGLDKSREAMEQDSLLIEDEIEDSALSLQELQREICKIEEDTARDHGLRKDIQQRVASVEETSKSRQNAKEALQSDLSHVLRELDKVKSQMARLQDTSVNEYGVQPSFFDGVDGAFDLPSLANHDMARLQTEVRTLKRRLQDLGPINTEAMGDYAVVQERYDFLKEQQGDLIEAREQLHMVIEEMDEVSGARFTQTFHQVQQEFEQIFVKLFGGGSAELMLTPAARAEDVGLEIAVRPPGKRLQNMNLLSGGERALTAISLQFALLRVRPSPFCVLDEIDAALDESNLKRFTELLREFSVDTQFIMITHRPGSMEVADTLYGVTMNRANISQLVAVELDAAATTLEE